MSNNKTEKFIAVYGPLPLEYYVYKYIIFKITAYI